MRNGRVGYNFSHLGGFPPQSQVVHYLRVRYQKELVGSKHTLMRLIVGQGGHTGMISQRACPSFAESQILVWGDAFCGPVQFLQERIV